MTSETKRARVELDGLDHAIRRVKHRTDVHIRYLHIRYLRCCRALEDLEGAERAAADHRLGALETAAITAGVLYTADVVFAGRVVS